MFQYQSQPPRLRRGILAGLMASFVPEAKGPNSPFILQYDGPLQIGDALDWAAKENVHALDILVSRSVAAQIEPDWLNGELHVRNLRCTAVGTGGEAAENKVYLSHPNPENRRAAIDAIAAMMRFAAQIGENGVPVIIGSLQGMRYSTSTRLTPATDRWPEARWPEKPEAQKLLKAGLRELGHLAGELGVPLLLEPLNVGESNLGTLAELDALVDSLGIPSIQFLIDSYHFLCEGWKGVDLVNLKTKIGYVHLVGLDRWYIGHPNDSRRIADFAHVLSNTMNYSGSMIAECGPWPNAETAMRKTMQWVVANFGAESPH